MASTQLSKIFDPECTRCPLYRTAHTVCVPGDGSVDARVMLIGEAPGRLEDANGRPFIGRAGTQLDRALSLAWDSDSARRMAYITNIVKCRPPRNRDPEALEKAMCSSVFLFKEIDLVDPQVIVPLGNHALEYFGYSGIMSNRGEWIYWKGKYVLPTVHPAATLYRPETFDLLCDDLRLAGQKAGIS